MLNRLVRDILRSLVQSLMFELHIDIMNPAHADLLRVSKRELNCCTPIDFFLSSRAEYVLRMVLFLLEGSPYGLSHVLRVRGITWSYLQSGVPYSAQGTLTLELVPTASEVPKITDLLVRTETTVLVRLGVLRRA